MKHLTTILITLAMALAGCNDHNYAGNDDCVDCNDNNVNNTNNVVNNDFTVETLSPSKTALWVEFDTNEYDFALARDRTDSDPDLIGHVTHLDEDGLSAMIVTGDHELIVEADGLIEVLEVPADKIGQFEMLVRNIWYMPVSWQPNLFPTTEEQAYDLEILLSAFICAQNLNLYSRGCQGQIPSSLFRMVGETADYRWVNPGHAKYVFIIKRPY